MIGVDEAGAPPSRRAPTGDERKRSGKPNAGTPAYSRFINRPFGRRLAALAFRTGRTPDQVSAASATCSLLAVLAIALAPQTWWLGIVVAALFVLGYGLDSADGQLARMRGGGSPAGEWLDHMIDISKTVLLHSAVLIRFHWLLVGHGWAPAWQLLPLAYLCVAVVMFFGLVLVDQLRRQAPGPAAPNPRGNSLLAALIILPTDFGVACLVFVTLGWPTVFVVLYGLLGLSNLVFLLAALRKWKGDLSRLARA